MVGQKEMLVALAVLSEGEKGKRLFSFVSPRDQAPLERLVHQCLREPRNFMKERLKNLSLYEGRLAFEETHPEWFIEGLREESPRLLRLLIDFLSVPRQEALLGYLSSDQRRQIPRTTRPVSPALLDQVRLLIERKIRGDVPPASEGRFTFVHIASLKGEDLKTLLKDLGMDEVCRAFHGLNPSFIRALFSRCPLSDASEMNKRLQSGEEIPLEEKKKSQKHLLSLPLGQMSPEALFLEVGFSLFGRALNVAEIDFMRPLASRLPLAEGYRLLRALDERRISGVETDTAARKRIFRSLKALFRQEKIQRYWKDEEELETTSLFREAG